MVRHLKALAALAEDADLPPSNHIAAHNDRNFGSREPSDFCRYCLREVHRHG